MISTYQAFQIRKSLSSREKRNQLWPEIEWIILMRKQMPIIWMKIWKYGPRTPSTWVQVINKRGRIWIRLCSQEGRKVRKARQSSRNQNENSKNKPIKKAMRAQEATIAMWSWVRIRLGREEESRNNQNQPLTSQKIWNWAPSSTPQKRAVLDVHTGKLRIRCCKTQTKTLSSPRAQA